MTYNIVLVLGIHHIWYFSICVRVIYRDRYPCSDKIYQVQSWELKLSDAEKKNYFQGIIKKWFGINGLYEY